jgi:hypothetical protein
MNPYNTLYQVYFFIDKISNISWNIFYRIYFIYDNYIPGKTMDVQLILLIIYHYCSVFLYF